MGVGKDTRHYRRFYYEEEFYIFPDSLDSIVGLEDDTIDSFKTTKTVVKER